MATLLARMEAIDQAAPVLYDMLNQQSGATKALSVLVKGLQTELDLLAAITWLLAN